MQSELDPFLKPLLKIDSFGNDISFTKFLKGPSGMHESVMIFIYVCDKES
jgi:hypothetical protein